MDKECPLYPELTKQGKEEAQKIMDSFKPKLVEIMEDILGTLYTDVSYSVESDHWTNYRNSLMDGFRGYGSGKPNHEHDYKELRRAIYDNNKEEIVKDLNDDLVKKNCELKKEVERLRGMLRESRY